MKAFRNHLMMYIIKFVVSYVSISYHDTFYCRCKQKVPAQKRFSVHKPPNVLTISFKRLV